MSREHCFGTKCNSPSFKKICEKNWAAPDEQGFSGFARTTLRKKNGVIKREKEDSQE